MRKKTASAIELIYDADCPNVADARRSLHGALLAAGRRPEWVEWDRASSASPEYACAYGSPTILIDNKDVAGQTGTDANCCRVYASADGLSGVPPMELIRAALSAAGPGSAAVHPRTAFALLPALGSALLPKLTCAACFPAYAAALGSLGIGFINYTPYLAPLMVISLGLVLVTLAYDAFQRKRFGPLALAALAAGLVLAARFVIESEVAMYAGLAGLLGASIWNTIRRSALFRTNSAANCTACDSHQRTGAEP